MLKLVTALSGPAVLALAAVAPVRARLPVFATRDADRRNAREARTASALEIASRAGRRAAVAALAVRPRAAIGAAGARVSVGGAASLRRLVARETRAAVIRELAGLAVGKAALRVALSVETREPRAAIRGRVAVFAGLIASGRTADSGFASARAAVVVLLATRAVGAAPLEARAVLAAAARAAVDVLPAGEIRGHALAGPLLAVERTALEGTLARGALRPASPEAEPGRRIRGTAR